MKNNDHKTEPPATDEPIETSPTKDMFTVIEEVVDDFLHEIAIAYKQDENTNE